VRYGPEQACKVSETNRLTATLEEVAGKVLAKLAAKVEPEPAPGRHHDFSARSVGVFLKM
jgi:hypothetical protein